MMNVRRLVFGFHPVAVVAALLVTSLAVGAETPV